VKDENGDLLSNSHSILNRWKNYVHNVSDVWQIEVETLVPDLTRLEVEGDVANLKNNKSAGDDHFPAELIQAGGKTIMRSINVVIISA
jgi:hypothetical protein